MWLVPFGLIPLAHGLISSAWTNVHKQVWAATWVNMHTKAARGDSPCANFFNGFFTDGKNAHGLHDS
jgi:hypothetical protein